MAHLSIIKRNIKLGVKNLLLHKLRSMLTMLGLVFGVGSVIAMLAIGEGASEEALSQIRKLGSRNIIISSQKPAEENSLANNNVRMSVYGLLYDDYRRISETIPTILKTVPVKSMQKPCRYGKRHMDLRIVGTTEKWFDLVQRNVIAGRIISRKDVDEMASVAVLTDHGARKLLAAQNVVGSTIRLGGNAYEVIGIVQTESESAGTMQMPDTDVDVYVPISTTRLHYGDIFSQRKQGSDIREQVELHRIIVEVDNERNVKRTAAAIDRSLSISHKKQDYYMDVPLALLRQARATKRTFSIVLGTIAGISLLVGGIGIMNIMLATVTERTREIGIRRAIGAKRRHIVFQFLIETLVLSIIGGVTGIGMGLFIPWVVTLTTGMPTIVTAYSLILSLGISVSVGIIFGIYPAMRASELDPIIALRHE